MRFNAPVSLNETHVLDEFVCSEPELTKWLHERARKNQASGASRCFVLADDRQRVIGYYVLAAGSVALESAPGRLRRNMPDPIPVIVLGRLAVHREWVNQGLGRGLLKDALQRTLQACEQIGARALLCHAIGDEAKAFYLKYGFVESPTHPMTVMLGLK